ncbi:bifunctional adenosylcobinamide kinase/adenosylcobinamide-phosphate guanylyltransferase [Anaerobacillus alkaliphilus]|uniref:bifunctional adenosylcobinamide kinase/adenosylcobinamide-phosphate guanylyltransferase n=1 Tax=Anaerobacillus alkaliphilus TaxID=1548597 RepID=UPI0013755D96|nr:bifunctional adenosylcobinamide kinase/adenosylcobinamide-phosphate guanylyltransferase [Anaerobacillus alkaliphilus]
MLIFITGGVRSGKSSFAETLAQSFLTPVKNKLIYIATSELYDSEMSLRIQKHQEDRLMSGFTWETWEQPRQIENLVKELSDNQIILLDCLTTLLANELFYEEGKWSDRLYQEEQVKKILIFLDKIKNKNITLLLVSNELLNGGLNYDQATLTYMKLIGYLHQKIVEKASIVYLIEAGIPLLMKGCENIEGYHASRN